MKKEEERRDEKQNLREETVQKPTGEKVAFSAEAQTGFQTVRTAMADRLATPNVQRKLLFHTAFYRFEYNKRALLFLFLYPSLRGCRVSMFSFPVFGREYGDGSSRWDSGESGLL